MLGTHSCCYLIFSNKGLIHIVFFLSWNSRECRELFQETTFKNFSIRKMRLVSWYFDFMSTIETEKWLQNCTLYQNCRSTASLYWWVHCPCLGAGTVHKWQFKKTWMLPPSNTVLFRMICIKNQVEWAFFGGVWSSTVSFGRWEYKWKRWKITILAR